MLQEQQQVEEIVLHKKQSKIVKDLFVKDECRFAVVCAARGFGKSYLAATTAMLAVQELMELDPSVPNKNVALVAPTHGQAIDIYFPLLAYQFGLESHSEKLSRQTGTFWFPNNVILKLWSYEAIERMRGTGQYFVGGDEMTSWIGAGINVKEAWESIIEPCITTRWSVQNASKYNSKPGRAMLISTPKGYDYFYDLYNRQDTDPLWKSYHFTYKDSPYLDPVEIERVKTTIDELKFAREYLASFEDSGASVFYSFDRKEHIDKDLEWFEEKEDVHVAIDFNVGIMASVIFAIRGNQVHILDEEQGHPDTETLAKKLSERFKGHRIIAYPDPAGRQRKTSAAVGTTDFSILESHKIITRARTKAPPIIDSVAAVNKKFKTASGHIEMLVHPRCKHTINSIERTSWVESNPDRATIDKSLGIEHWSDALRYAIEYLFPIRPGTKVVARAAKF